MSKTGKSDQEIDPIDWFAREILKNPGRVEDVKERMRRTLGYRARPTVVQPDVGDVDDLWDNVPV